MRFLCVDLENTAMDSWHQLWWRIQKILHFADSLRVLICTKNSCSRRNVSFGKLHRITMFMATLAVMVWIQIILIHNNEVFFCKVDPAAFQCNIIRFYRVVTFWNTYKTHIYIVLHIKHIVVNTEEELCQIPEHVLLIKISPQPLLLQMIHWYSLQS